MKKIYLISQNKLDSLIAKRVEEALSNRNNDLEKELLLKQANLAALQEQINPHFLYNALECIRGQALIENANTVASATHALSQYFRYCISNKSSVVTLANEIAYVQNYVTIQQFRFQGKFRLEFQIDDESVLEAIVPKLMLQPLVENAIIHGFADKLHDGLVKITVKLSKKHLNITVDDNGCGMNTEQLQKVNERISCCKETTVAFEKRGNGVALRNVHNRLKLLFGEGYGLTMYSAGKNNGTSAEIFIPYTHSVNV